MRGVRASYLSDKKKVMLLRSKPAQTHARRIGRTVFFQLWTELNGSVVDDTNPIPNAGCKPPKLSKPHVNFGKIECNVPGFIFDAITLCEPRRWVGKHQMSDIDFRRDGKDVVASLHRQAPRSIARCDRKIKRLARHEDKCRVWIEWADG